MKCFRHPDRDACATCNECGKGLCHECAAAFEPALCSGCALKRSAANTTGEAKAILIKSAIFFVISFFISKFMLSAGDSSSPISMHLFMAVVFSGIPWGWSFISRVVPMVPFGNMMFLIGFYMFKLIAAYIIGIFIMGWNIIKILYLLYKGKTEKKQFQQIESQISKPEN